MADGTAIRLGDARPHCDACGFTGEAVALEQMRACIGMTCPKCDTVMITEDDCDTLEKMIKTVRAINAVTDALGLEVTDKRLGTLTLRTKDGGEVVGWTPNPEAAQ